MESQQAGVLKALSSSPLDLLNRWKKYKEETAPEKFGMPPNPNFPPNVNLPPVNIPPTNMPSSNIDSEAKWLFGLTGGLFLVVLLITLLPFFIAIYLLVKHGDKMPQWAKIAGWISALLPVPGGSIIAIILVYSTKSPDVE